MRTWLPPLLLAVAVAVACSGKGDAPKKAPETVAPGPAAPPKAAPGAPIGVAECDSFRDKMLKCITKLGPDAAGPAKNDLEDSWAAWQSAAVTADGKAALVLACKAATDAARPVYAPSGCEL